MVVLALINLAGGKLEEGGWRRPWLAPGPAGAGLGLFFVKKRCGGRFRSTG